MKSPAVLVATVLAAVLAVSIANAQSPESTEIIVRWTPSISLGAKSTAAVQALQEAASRHGVTASAKQRLATGSELIQLSRPLTDAERDDFIAVLRRSGSVKHAAANVRFRVAFTPNDTLYSEQWQYFEAAAGIRAPGAWDVASGAGVVVAVVDTGTTHHLDLQPNVVGGYDMISDAYYANDGTGRDSDYHDPGDWSAGSDSCGQSFSTWHGTRVSGTIGAVTHNGVGVSGVAFGARLLSVRVMGRCGGTLADITDGIAWAVGMAVPDVRDNPLPARVVNLSITIDSLCPEEMQDVIDEAQRRGVVIVAAAGNDSDNVSFIAPANCRGAIAVAAVNRSGGRAGYSNFGAKVALAAPGGDDFGNSSDFTKRILSTSSNGTLGPLADTYVSYQGTSMAAPHVTAVAALIIGKNLSFTPAQVETRLRDTARWFPQSCNLCGWGIVNAELAVKANPALAPALPSGFTVSPPSSSGSYSIAWRASAGATEYWTQRKRAGVWQDEARVTSALKGYTNSPPDLYEHRFKACSDSTGCSGWATGPNVTICRGECQ